MKLYNFDDLQKQVDHEIHSQHWAWRLARRLYVNRQCGWNRYVRTVARIIDRSTPKVKPVRINNER